MHFRFILSQLPTKSSYPGTINVDIYWARNMIIISIYFHLYEYHHIHVSSKVVIPNVMIGNIKVKKYNRP